MNPCSVCNDNHTNNNIVLNGTSGVIQSPNYPRNYPNGVICTWRIYPPEGKNVLLRFLNFSLQETNDCSDSVLVSDETICGNSSVLSSFLLSDSPVVVKFKSNERGSSAGFHAEFLTVEPKGKYRYIVVNIVVTFIAVLKVYANRIPFIDVLCRNTFLYKNNNSKNLL